MTSPSAQFHLGRLVYKLLVFVFLCFSVCLLFAFVFCSKVLFKVHSFLYYYLLEVMNDIYKVKEIIQLVRLWPCMYSIWIQFPALHMAPWVIPGIIPEYRTRSISWPHPSVLYFSPKDKTRIIFIKGTILLYLLKAHGFLKVWSTMIIQ